MYSKFPPAALALSMILALSVSLKLNAAPDTSAAPTTPPATAATSPDATAQPRIMGPDDPDNKLHMTPDQQTKFFAIEQKLDEQRKAIAADTKATDAEKEKRWNAAVDESRKQLQDILSPDQRALDASLQAETMKYLAAEQQMEKQWQALSNKLTASLTDEQKKKSDSFKAAAYKQLQALQKNTVMTPEQKDTKFRTIQVDYLNKQVGILSPSQKAIFKQMQDLRDKALALRKLVLDSKM